MAIKTVEKSESYAVLIGCNVSDGTRYEIGDPMFSDQVLESDIAELLEMGAIEECQ